MNGFDRKIMRRMKEEDLPSPKRPKMSLEEFQAMIAHMFIENINNPSNLDEKDMQAYDAILNFDYKVDGMVELLTITQKRRGELAKEGNEDQKALLEYLDDLVKIKVERDFIR